MADPEVQSLLQQLQQTAQPSKEADQEVGSGDVGGTVETKTPSPLVTLPMTEMEMDAWWKRVERARARVKAREEKWDILLNEYLPIISKSGEAETVKVQAHFRNVHSKLGSLFYRQPDLVLTPDDPSPAQDVIPNPMAAMQPPGSPPLPPFKMEDVISVKQAVLKKVLGRDGIKAARLMDELLFDVLCWAGIGCCKIGYRATMVPMPAPAPPPVQPGAVLGLQQPPPEPQPIFEEYYARRFSPKKALWNDDLRSTRFDEDATWMGMEFFITPKTAQEVYKLTEAEARKATEDDRVHKYPEDETKGSSPSLVRCIEIWPKASIFGQNPHPQALCQLVLVEGLKTKPAVWRPSPDQTFDPMGKLTEDSLIGFPIKVMTIRDLADSCFPPADSAFTNSEIKQLSTYRRQTIRIRDAAIGKYLFDVDAFGDTEVEQLKNGEIGEFIPVEGGKMKDGVDKIFAQTTRIQGSADDQRGFQGIKQDMGETLGIGSNQAGTETDTVRTATESDRVAQAIQSRNDKELSRVVDLYLDIARGIDQLLMRYMDQNAWVHMGGEEGAARMQVWNGKLITGKYLYDIAPDSQLRPDSARDFQLTMQHYNLTAKDPLSNRTYLLKRMARQRGLDPAKAVLPPPPPPKPVPEPLKLSLSIVAADLTNPLVLAFIAQYGQAPDPTLNVKGEAAAQPQHGGPAEPADVISQHLQSNSGGKQNAPGADNHREGQVK